MRHGRRTRLKVEDVDHAFKVKNIEVGNICPASPLLKLITRSASRCGASPRLMLR